MRNTLIYIAALTATLCALYFYSKKTALKTPKKIFIQGIVNSPVLKNITQSLSEKINFIIKEELDIEHNNELNFFSPKKIQRLTLYAINDLHNDARTLLVTTLDHINMNTFIAHNVTINPEVEFFDGPFGDKDELVVSINDNNKELSLFNKSIKDAMHHANAEYLQKQLANLYNIAKSERYPYTPHIGLGRIRSNSIKNQLKDQAIYSAVFERIQSRVKKATLEHIHNQLNKSNNRIVFEKIVIFDLANQSWIKEYIISNK